MVEKIRADALAGAIQEPRDLLTEFQTSLIASGREETTIDRYLQTTKAYCNMKSHHGFFTRQRVNEYLSRLRAKGCVNNTLRQRFYTLKTFFRVNRHPFPFTKNDLPPASPKRRVMFTEGEMRKLEAKARTWGPRNLRPRNYALTRLANSIGIRRIEFHMMNIEDIVFSENVSRDDEDHWTEEGTSVAYVQIQTAKHGKVVEREVDPVTEDALRFWVDIRTRRRVGKGIAKYFGGTLGQPTPLWTAGKTGKRLTPHGLTGIIRKIRKECGIEKQRAGYHASRRARITDYHNKGATPSEITQEMGWTDETTVLGYIQPDIATTKRKIRNTWGDRGRIKETETQTPTIILGNRGSLLRRADSITTPVAEAEVLPELILNGSTPEHKGADALLVSSSAPVELNGAKKIVPEEEEEDDEVFLALFNLKRG